MSSMNIITKNKAGTIGIVSDVEGLKDVGDFSIRDLEAWLAQIKLVLGDDKDLCIEFKLSENPKTPGYMITASHGSDPKVAVCGQYRLDGKHWGE